ncbi:MAG: HAD family hydrolase [Flavobacteriaceae bacterium]
MKPLSKYKALIFDMDGTLVDNMHYHHDAWMQFIDEKQLGIDAETFERDYHKGTIVEVMARFCPHLKSEEALRAVGNEKEILYRDTFGSLLQPLPGLHSFFEYLKAKDIPLGLATMGDQNNLDMTLKQLKIETYFHSTTGGDQVTKGKPHPEIFLRAAAKIKMAPEYCLAFEDTQSGIQSAQAAGMDVVGVATQFSKQQLLNLGCVNAIADYTEMVLNPYKP